jgi:hypothetical protein
MTEAEKGSDGFAMGCVLRDWGEMMYVGAPASKAREIRSVQLE